jgi:hypothetical protein
MAFQLFMVDVAVSSLSWILNIDVRRSVGSAGTGP